LPIFPENNPMNIIGKGELQQFDFVCSAHELLQQMYLLMSRINALSDFCARRLTSSIQARWKLQNTRSAVDGQDEPFSSKCCSLVDQQ
jgi:hypothetical protein